MSRSLQSMGASYVYSQIDLHTCPYVYKHLVIIAPADGLAPPAGTVLITKLGVCLMYRLLCKYFRWLYDIIQMIHVKYHDRILLERRQSKHIRLPILGRHDYVHIEIQIVIQYCKNFAEGRCKRRTQFSLLKWVDHHPRLVYAGLN